MTEVRRLASSLRMAALLPGYSPRVIEFGFAVDVARPPEKVFAYLSDPEKLSEWQGAAEVTQLTDGPVGPGTRFREVHVAMGRRMESVTEFAEYEPPRRLRVRIVEGPLPVDGLWELEPVAGGTRIRFQAEGAAKGVMGLIEPLLALTLRRRFRAQHEQLKRILEAQ